MAKVVHIHIPGQRKDYYFSSLAAVYEVLSAEEIGISYERLSHAGLSSSGAIATRKALIKTAPIIGTKKKKP